MVSKLCPDPNRIYFIEKYSLFHILEGTGAIQVDFKNYVDWADKLLFLEKGQYIKFFSDDFVVRRIEFDDELIFRDKSYRVLFKHLVSLGYINFSECADCHRYLSHTTFFAEMSEIIDVSSQQWYWQNPFDAEKSEYHIIFDVKEIIDREYRNHLTAENLADMLKGVGVDAYGLVSDKVGFTVRNMLGSKRLLESRKEVAFANKSVKEIAYDMGYKDPGYFNRSFKQATGQTPGEFRSQIDFSDRDTFVNDLFRLLHDYHKTEHNVGFYAGKMNVSVKTLSKKVRDKLNLSIGQLIRSELVKTAMISLQTGRPVKDIAHELGFTEAHHFSAFIKQYTGKSPSEIKKYNS